MPDDVDVSDDASSDAEEFIADPDDDDTDEAQSPEVGLLDFEAEEDDEGEHSDNDVEKVQDVGEDLDAYESSFIDDSDLHEREHVDEERQVADITLSGDEDMSHADSDSIDVDEEDDVPLCVLCYPCHLRR